MFASKKACAAQRPIRFDRGGISGSKGNDRRMGGMSDDDTGGVLGSEVSDCDQPMGGVSDKHNKRGVLGSEVSNRAMGGISDKEDRGGMSGSKVNDQEMGDISEVKEDKDHTGSFLLLTSQAMGGMSDDDTGGVSGSEESNHKKLVVGRKL